MQMFCLRDKRNMWTGPKEDTPAVVGRDSVLLRIYVQETSITRRHVLGLTQSQPRGPCATPWGARS